MKEVQKQDELQSIKNRFLMLHRDHRENMVRMLEKKDKLQKKWWPLEVGAKAMHSVIISRGTICCRQIACSLQCFDLFASLYMCELVN